MAFRKPISTLGGLVCWENIKQNDYFILQEHKAVWPYKYRILMRENRMEIANSNDHAEITYDWKYLEEHAVPQLDKKIDWLNDDKMHEFVVEVITKMIPKIG